MRFGALAPASLYEDFVASADLSTHKNLVCINIICDEQDSTPIPQATIVGPVSILASAQCHPQTLVTSANTLNQV